MGPLNGSRPVYAPKTALRDNSPMPASTSEAAQTPYGDLRGYRIGEVYEYCKESRRTRPSLCALHASTCPGLRAIDRQAPDAQHREFSEDAMLNNNRAIFTFGDFRLDVAEARLTRRGQAIPLSPKAFSMLVLLVERAGELVDKEEILRVLWPDSVVEEANLTVHISALRKALATE